MSKPRSAGDRPAPPLTLGSAGHIDHGKTALIRALTGTDTDRLPEERARGISIELGYAVLALADGRRLSVVDVPGHERFVRTMVAGATGIDLVLMVIAADDGVMPQTREHAAVLRALDVRRGVVALTKCDVADPAPARAAAGALLPRAEVVATSARTGAGLTTLREAIARAADQTPTRAATPGPARLHIDRVFTIRGAGTVVTGTLWAGALAAGMEVSALPDGPTARIRGVQVHGDPVQRAEAGQRVAINLRGASRQALRRGQVLAATGTALAATHRLDCALQFEPGREPTDGERAQVHHGTRETAARLVALGSEHWQLRLESPVVALAGDRVVIRRIAPPDTLGGGVVLDATPPRHGPRAADSNAARTPDVRGRPAEAASTGPPPLGPSEWALAEALHRAGLAPPPESALEPGGLAVLRQAGLAIRVGKAVHLHRDVLGAAEQRIVELATSSGGEVTIAQVRDALGTSRRIAQALLEHLDSERVLIRRGDVHRIRRRPAPHHR